jgi:hypothetical protein
VAGRRGGPRRRRTARGCRPATGPARLGGAGPCRAGWWSCCSPGTPAGRIDRQKTWLRIVTGVVIAFLTLANLLAAGRLVVEILTNNKLFAAHPGALLAALVIARAINVL